jgi:hypothetical protein
MNELSFKTEVLRYFDDLEAKALFLIAIAYHNGELTRESYFGQLKSLRKGLLLKEKKSYHCKLDGRWYNDQSISSILSEIADYSFDHLVLTGDDLLTTIQDYSNKNYNYCINLLYSKYIKEILNKCSFYSDVCEDLIIRGFDFPIDIRVEGTDYRCDCCGREKQEVNRYLTIENAETKMMEYLQSLKKGNQNKIPKLENVYVYKFIK